jgi:hypothetical protein
MTRSPGREAGDALAHLHDDAAAFVAQHGGEQALRVVAAQRERVGVAHAGVGDLDQHLPALWRGHVDLDDLEGFSSGKGNSGATLHAVLVGAFRGGGASREGTASGRRRHALVRALETADRADPDPSI